MLPKSLTLRIVDEAMAVIGRYRNVEEQGWRQNPSSRNWLHDVGVIDADGWAALSFSVVL
jgi:hypothetical protein